MKRILFLLFIGIWVCGCSKDNTESEHNNNYWNIPCPNNEIRYKTKYGYPIEMPIVDGFGGRVQSNTYNGEYGRIVFDDDIKDVPKNAFENCSTLTNVILPDCLNTIGGNAFKDCSELLSVNMGSSLNSISAYAFNGCNKLQRLYGNHVSSDGRCVIIDGVLQAVVLGDLTTYKLPSDVVTIGSNTFYRNQTLKSLSMCDNVTTIENSAFSSCANLSDVELSDNIVSIGNRAFYGCNNLKYIHFGSRIVKIGDEAFNNCKMLDNIIIPQTVSEIGRNVFRGCVGTLTVNCNLPNDIYNASGYYNAYDGAFSGTYFTDIIIGDNVTEIGENMFYSCSKMKNLTIGKSVRSIGDFAFSKSNKLEFIYIRSMIPPQLGQLSFDGYTYGIYDDNYKYKGDAFSFDIPTLKAIYVPVSAVDTYHKDETWKNVKGYDFGN